MIPIDLIAGYAGALMSLVAFVLSSLGRLSRGTYIYMAMNGIGAFLLVYYGLVTGAYLFGYLNIIWGGVEIFYLFKKLSKKPVKRNRR